MTSPVKPGRPRAGDPYGLGPVAAVLAPGLAVVGLLIVALATVSLFQGELPFGIGRGPAAGPGSNPDDPNRTPAPSNVVVIPPRDDDEPRFSGAITYAKAGNIWVQTDDGARQLTSSGHDAMPSWSPDGEWIYYIETRTANGLWPVRGRPGRYDMPVPHLRRIRADGSATRPEELRSGRFKSGRYVWFYWMRQPVVAPNGRTVAMVTDQPNPEERDVVVQFYNLETERFSRPDLRSTANLGHQDPAWHPNGRFLLFVRNGREGTRSAPVIYRYDLTKKTSAAITGAGYLEPNYSPDGKYIVATRTSSIGTDIVILDGTRGTELLKVTSDGRSWGPVWAPTGDSIAFLNINGLSVDLHLAKLTGPAGAWTIEKTIALTDVSGLDAASRPDWFVPPDDLPSASPSPTASPSAPPAS
jgi:dipeptidyl aminopeptidase/acylaminoacyl peptidase